MTAPVDPIAANPLLSAARIEPGVAPPVLTGASFSRMMADGIEQVNARLLDADQMTRAFALGADIPVHQVTFALEQARLSFELMNQVRTRLVESYQEILRMQV